MLTLNFVACCSDFYLWFLTSPFWDKVGASFWQEAAEEALVRQQEMEERRQRHLEVLVQELPCNGRQVNEVLGGLNSRFVTCSFIGSWMLRDDIGRCVLDGMLFVSDIVECFYLSMCDWIFLWWRWLYMAVWSSETGNNLIQDHLRQFPGAIWTAPTLGTKGEGTARTGTRAGATWQRLGSESLVLTGKHRKDSCGLNMADHFTAVICAAHILVGFSVAWTGSWRRKITEERKGLFPCHRHCSSYSWTIKV